mgnify:FL=1|tara:strand:- start:14051 stop:15025 length:975 start_codon:yes stop_codon:yes gene_type:complete
MSRRRLRRGQRRAYSPGDQLTPTQVSGAFNIQNHIRSNGIESINTLPPQSGLANSQSPDPGLNFNTTEAEKVIKNPAGNSYIVFGRDRPSSQLSGYGSIGASRCDTIDIVVGRMAAARQGRGAKLGTYVENHFGLDAARIYISALTDVDQNFGLAEGMGVNSTGRSAIGMKADALRLIGREGIKIITGRSYAFTNFGSDGETNSVGGRTQRSGPIELNAGNQPKEQLQGVALGNNTLKALEEMSTIVDALIGGMLRSHTVMSAFLSALVPVPVIGAAAGVTSTEYMRISLESLYALKNQVNSFKLNYIIDRADSYVVSTNVFTT